MSLYDFSLQLKNLNKAKNYEGALHYFKTNKTVFGTDEIGKNKYVAYEVMTACIALNYYDAVFVFIEQYDVELDATNIFYLLKQAGNKQNIHWGFINRMCDLIQPDNLSLNCIRKTITIKGRDKQIEFASEKENWFAYKTKALFELGQYEACCHFASLALSHIDVFHYANDIWFARRIALSKKKLGNNAEALSELFNVLKRKKEWFIQYEIAQIYFESKLLQEAFSYCIDALTNLGDIAYKVGLIELFATILEHNQESEMAWKHLQLSKSLRENAAWNVPNNLQNRLALYENQFQNRLMLNPLLSELKDYWKKHNTSVSKTTKEIGELKGKVSKLIHNNEQGADGFISFENKKVYFRLGADHRFSKKIRTGMPVVFKIIPSDGKHKRSRAIITRMNDTLEKVN